MERLAELPRDMVFVTHVTMEAAEDPDFLDAMRKAHISGALVGVEAVTKEGLKAVFKTSTCPVRIWCNAFRNSRITEFTFSARLYSDCPQTAQTHSRPLKNLLRDPD
jgi:hypothetical protein